MTIEFPWLLQKSTGNPCDHCGESIDNGFLIFQPVEAFHESPNGDSFPCKHWLCLSCCSRIVTKWTRDSGVAYRPSRKEDRPHYQNQEEPPF